MFTDQSAGAVVNLLQSACLGDPQRSVYLSLGAIFIALLVLVRWRLDLFDRKAW